MCEREPKNSSDRYAVAVKNELRNYHRTFTSKAVAGVFAVFAMGKYMYTVASVSVEREHVEWRIVIICCRKNSL